MELLYVKQKQPLTGGRMAIALTDIKASHSPKELNSMRWRLRAVRRNVLANGADSECVAYWEGLQSAVDERLKEYLPQVRKNHAPVPTEFLRGLFQIPARGALQEERPRVHLTYQLDTLTTLTYTGYRLY